MPMFGLPTISLSTLLPIGESGMVASRVVMVREAYNVDSELQRGADGA